MLSQNIPNKVSRRYWIREAAMAATGAAMLPSLLSGCTDHPPGLGSETDLYIKAAANLKNMQAWYEELDKRNTKYLFHVYTAVKGGETPPEDWKDILIDVFVKIGIAFLEAATEEVPGLGAAIAIAAEEYEKWGAEKSQGGTVDAAFGEFTDVLDEIYDRVDNILRSLQDPKPSNGYADYGNLREAFKNGGGFEFKGKKYDLQSLANANFPDGGTDAFVNLLTPAELSFKKTLWEAIIIKAGKLHLWPTTWQEYTYGTDPRKIIRDLFANNTDIPGAYFRAYYDNGPGSTYVMEYQFLFDGRKLDDKTSAELFKDTIRGHVVNPNALFERDYVFKQFRTEKYDFGKYCDVATEQSSAEYDCSDYTFTGGILNGIFK